MLVQVKKNTCKYLICVFDPEYELAARTLGQEIAEQRRSQPSNVHNSCRRWSETSPGGIIWEFAIAYVDIFGVRSRRGESPPK